MKSTNRKRALITSGAIVLLCMTIIVGMTWALFTDTQTVTNHLQAGDMKITLNRTQLVKKTLDDDGYLVETMVQSAAEDEAVPFDNPTGENVFGLEADEVIVPGSKFVATMQVQNNSDAAFKYWVKIDCKDEDAAKELAEQLVIIVYTDKNKDGVIDTDEVTDDSDVSIIANGLTVGDDQNYIGIVETGSSEDFIVSLEFRDDGYSYVDGVLTSNNNVAKKKTSNFDLIVYAVQVTQAP